MVGLSIGMMRENKRAHLKARGGLVGRSAIGTQGLMQWLCGILRRLSKEARSTGLDIGVIAVMGITSGHTKSTEHEAGTQTVAHESAETRCLLDVATTIPSLIPSP